MKTLQELRTRLLQDRKQGNKVQSSFLSTLIGEVELEMKKVSTDEKELIQKIATKFKKNINETTKKLGKVSSEQEQELVLLSHILPKDLSESEIRVIVTNMVHEHGTDKKIIMPALKKITGMNMKYASQILNSL